MNSIFKYSLLKYNHSKVLNEEIVVGILFYFPDTSQFSFIFPERLTRINKFYSNFSEVLVKGSLKAIKGKVLQLNRQLVTFELEKFEDFIHKQILILDSTSLQFSKVQTSVLFSENIDEILENYRQLFLNNFEIDNKIVHRHDERFILREFKKTINQLNSDFEKHLIKDKVIESEKANLKFDYAWQNGSLNLIKPLSFDLAEKSSINEKAILYYGTLNLLTEKANQENFRFDFLVSKPQSRTLFKAYDNAIDILNESPAPHQIIEENDLKKYTVKALEYLQKN